MEQNDMTYFAIRNKKDGRYLHGTDFRHYPPTQILESESCPPKLFSEIDIDSEIRRRHISLSKYDVVKVRITESRPKK